MTEAYNGSRYLLASLGGPAYGQRMLSFDAVLPEML